MNNITRLCLGHRPPMREDRRCNAAVERLTEERNACSRLASQAVNDLAMAQNRIAALEAENARLAAWQCIHLDGVTGITSDEHGHQSCAKDVEITRLKTENADQPEKRRKASHVGVPAIFKLELACQILNQAHDSFGCYLVGSALDRPDWRDVDVVMIMKDEDFDREFPNAGANWEFDQKWLLNSITISAWLTEQSGVPVDFKIQPQGHANAMHKGRRNAIGLQFPCAKDAAR